MIARMPNYDSMSDADLEALCHKRAFDRNLEFVVEVRKDQDFYRYNAAFKSFTDPGDIAPHGAVLFGAEAPTRREAVVGLLQGDDLARELGD